MRGKWAVPVIIGISIILIVFSGISPNDGTPVVTPPNFKVAFIGDQGHNENAIAVLQLIKDEGAQMVLHQGDFDYLWNPNDWDDRINSVLGDDFPYFASIGNEDKQVWDPLFKDKRQQTIDKKPWEHVIKDKRYTTSGYQLKLTERLAKISNATCTGDIGVKSSCNYQGLFFINSGVGVMGSGHDTFIKDELSKNDFYLEHLFLA